MRHEHSVILRSIVYLMFEQADPFDATERVGVSASHRELLRDKTVFELIKRWLGIEQNVKKHSKMSRVAHVGSFHVSAGK